MKKIFGIEAEVNITADDDMAKGIGKGIAKGSVSLLELYKDIKPEIIKALRKTLLKENDKKEE